jgi:hypothetical protein
MLNDLRHAPIISEDTFQPEERKLLHPEKVEVINMTCAWIESFGTMLVNDDEWNVIAALVPIQQLSNLDLMAGDSDHKFTEFPRDTDKPVVLRDEHGTGLLDSLALIIQNPTVGDYGAHVFNGYAEELLNFDAGDTLEDVMDTVVTMFAVVGRGGNE